MALFRESAEISRRLGQGRCVAAQGSGGELSEPEPIVRALGRRSFMRSRLSPPPPSRLCQPRLAV
jgi:hypothetical protein